MSLPQPGVYRGTLHHCRTAPVRHAFTFPLFMVLLDVDRIPELMDASPFTSINRWNWASFHDADHLGDPSRPLRQRLAADAAAHARVLPDGPIFLLTHLRYLGYCFNPVSFYYCYDRGGRLRLVLAEVNNTFDGHHNYWLDPAPARFRDATESGQDPAVHTYRAGARKSFYVSPFMPADMTYAFTFTEPGHTLALHMSLAHPGGSETTHSFHASLRLDFHPWMAREIASALLRYPAMTVNVMAGIYREALRLWWKGLPIVPRSTPTGEYVRRAPEAGLVSRQ